MKTFAELNFPGASLPLKAWMARENRPKFICQALARVTRVEGILQRMEFLELVKAATSKGKKRELLTPTTFSLIHATDFADRYEAPPGSAHARWLPCVV
jgi:dTMP kinase